MQAEAKRNLLAAQKELAKLVPEAKNDPVAIKLLMEIQAPSASKQK